MQALSFSDVVNVTTSDAAKETFIKNIRQKKRHRIEAAEFNNSKSMGVSRSSEVTA